VGHRRARALQNHHNGLLQGRYGYSADLRRNRRKVFQQFVAYGASFSGPSNLGPLDIRTWHSNIEQHASEGVNKILIGNKSDWLDKRQISQEQGQALANEFGIRFMETSAKVNEGVEDAFFTLARQVGPHPASTGQN
jgi:Ras family